ALGYGTPEPEFGFLPIDHNLEPAGPIIAQRDPLVVTEITAPGAAAAQTLSFQLAGFAAAATDGEGDGDGDCIPPTGPVHFVPQTDSEEIFNNDDFGPSGPSATTPLVSFTYTGSTLVDNIHGVPPTDPSNPSVKLLTITSLDPTKPWTITVIATGPDAGLATVTLTGPYDHGGADDGPKPAFEPFDYTILNALGQTASAHVS